MSLRIFSTHRLISFILLLPGGLLLLGGLAARVHPSGFRLVQVMALVLSLAFALLQIRAWISPCKKVVTTLVIGWSVAWIGAFATSGLATNTGGMANPWWLASFAMMFLMPAAIAAIYLATNCKRGLFFGIGAVCLLVTAIGSMMILWQAVLSFRSLHIEPDSGLVLAVSGSLVSSLLIFATDEKSGIPTKAE